MIQFFLLSSLIYGCKKPKKHVEEETAPSLEWMCGTWEGIDSTRNETSYEIWSGSDRTLDGIAYDLSEQGDTGFFEKMSVVERDSHYYFKAELARNATAVYFKMVSLSDSSVRFENPSHDFPKFIQYQRVEDTLKAQIGDSSDSRKFIYTIATYHE